MSNVVKLDGRAVSSSEWRDGFERGPNGSPVPNVANVHHALRFDPKIKDCISFDEMLQTVVLISPLPDQHGFEEVRPITDVDVTLLQEYLQNEVEITRVGMNIVQQAVDARARDRGRKFHPVREYLDDLEWDGKKRLDNFLSRYFGAEQNDYTAEIGRMFMTSAVARIMSPGCKADHMLVLEGPQGSKKSTACQILAGEYFSDGLPDITTKDSLQHLLGKWIIEVAEMSAMTRVETNALKAFLTRTEERYRPPYGRRDVHQPRQCVFIGTTNKETYLKDETGGRRFWPVKCGDIDTKALKRDRDQLFAEALRRYKQGSTWWPSSDFERKHIAPEQEKRFDEDPWEDVIRRFVGEKERVSNEAIAKALGFEEAKGMDMRHHTRIGNIMKRLGRKSDRNWKGRGWVK